MKNTYPRLNAFLWGVVIVFMIWTGYTLFIIWKPRATEPVIQGVEFTKENRMISLRCYWTPASPPRIEKKVKRQK